MTDEVVSTRLPPGWRIAPLSTVVAEVNGGFSVNCEDRAAKTDEIGVLKTGAVAYGVFDPTQNKYVIPAEHKRVRTRVSAGSIIFCRKNSEEVIGACALVEHDQTNLFLSDLLWEIRPNRDVSSRWLEALMKSHAVASIVRLRATGTQASMKNISQDRLLSIAVPIPPSNEQYAIAEVLKTWDEAIKACERLRLKKIEQATWFRTDLFTGKVRLKGFSGEWRKQPLSAVLTERGLRSAGTEEVFSVSVHKGLVNQIEHLGRSFAAKETAHYNRVLPGDVVYTKSPTGDFPLGIIKQSKLDYDVIVSPLYGVFTPTTRDLGVILDAYFRSPLTVRNYLAPLVQKGAKNTIAITNSRFLEGELNLPLDFKEHRAIAEVIEDADAEIAAIERQMAAYQTQKRGLMQKLLTGEWRVKGAKEAAA